MWRCSTPGTRGRFQQLVFFFCFSFFFGGGGVHSFLYLWHEQRGLCTLCVTKIPGSQDGVFISPFPAWEGDSYGCDELRFDLIPSVMTGFIVNVFPFRNRVSCKEAFEVLELVKGNFHAQF